MYDNIRWTITKFSQDSLNNTCLVVFWTPCFSFSRIDWLDKAKELSLAEYFRRHRCLLFQRALTQSEIQTLCRIPTHEWKLREKAGILKLWLEKEE